MNLSDRTVEEFLTSLASAEPTPGGGSAAALAAAQGAALVAMVARLSQRDTPEAAAAVDRADRLRTALTELVEEDARAFEEVMAAYRLPKATPEDRARRQEAVQQALRTASEVPLRVMAQAVEVLQTAADLVDRANPRTISDLGVAAVLTEAGAAGAQFNVTINTQSIKDTATATSLSKRAAAAGTSARQLRDAVTERVAGRLASG